LRKVKPASAWASLPLLAALLTGAATLSGCGAQIKPGMSKKEVETVLGSPDTTSTIGGDAFYYISTTQKTIAFLKPYEINRQVVAVYFDGHQTVRDVAHYGLKDGIVVNYYRGETPARGKDLTFLEQIFGNIENRRRLKGSAPSGGTPADIPGT
jgi:outer membrane protein assembly factor BamE (lipoprotein component of BamABCDE complex)